MDYNCLLQMVDEEGIDIIEHYFSTRGLKGLYVDKSITLNSSIDTQVEKKCVLAEELGHHYTTAGNILNQKSVVNRKKEALARNWGYDRLVTVEGLIEAYEAGVRNRYELAEFLDVTEDYLNAALKYYRQKHGLCYQINDYVIYFDPLVVIREYP